jgi:peptidoglycan/xylan/chitin deacetylase (PgdA/CDA1 family)
MRIPGRKAMLRAWRWGRSRAGARAAILGYHRIAEEAWDPFDLCLRPEWFAEHLEVLRERALPVGLGELARTLRNGELPERAVVVTFDDGYLNNLDVVKPLLERFEIPATLFVVSAARGREFWWDELSRLMHPDRRWESAPRLTVEPGAEPWVPPAEVDRREAAVMLARRLRALPAGRIREVLCDLRRQVSRDDGSATHRCMNDDELRRIASGGLVEIGSHTCDHPPLAGRPEAEQRREVAESKASLEASTGSEVRSFSYPNGSRDALTRALVREAGYGSACGSVPDVVRQGSDPFDLPRFWLPPCDGRGFARWLDRWVA